MMVVRWCLPSRASPHQTQTAAQPQHSPPSPRQQARKRSRKHTTKNTRASLKGSHAPGDRNNKWSRIQSLMREQRIGVLALQESHLTEAHLQLIHSLYGRRLSVHTSACPDNPNSKGVSFVLNKECTNVRDVKTETLVPGRALLITLPWHKDLSITILNVYAPNDHTENAQFWLDLAACWNGRTRPKPDVMLGDFNITEDAIDRFPCREDHAPAIEALVALKAQLGLGDGWRQTNPEARAYTFSSPGPGSSSRLDRIYAKDQIVRTAYDWDIAETAVPTDHSLISVHINDQKLPYIGTGRWTTPLFLLENTKIVEEIEQMGRHLENAIYASTAHRTLDDNPQILYTKFKREVKELLRKKARTSVPKIQITIANLQRQLLALQNSIANTADEEAAHMESKLIRDRIRHLEQRRAWKAQRTTAARYRLEGETVCKWCTRTPTCVKKNERGVLRLPLPPPRQN
ncbi:DNase I-like protein [Obba rivulosa]|uniref:DNase I-like protein n=1 Tax=Obba rivulosa TaxID=1052685 RepID=A0A8E2DSX8_9APHY|nr:DNase I-like protein [Obba rivulosa]